MTALHEDHDASSPREQDEKRWPYWLRYWTTHLVGPLAAIIAALIIAQWRLQLGDLKIEIETPSAATKIASPTSVTASIQGDVPLGSEIVLASRGQGSTRLSPSDEACDILPNQRLGCPKLFVGADGADGRGKYDIVVLIATPQGKAAIDEYNSTAEAQDYPGLPLVDGIKIVESVPVERQ